MNTNTERTSKCIRAATALAAGALFFLGLLQAASGQPQCPMVRCDTRSTGRALGTTNDLRYAWSITADSPTTPVIGADGTLYFGTSDRCFSAYSGAGAVEWTYRTDATISGNAAIAADGTVYLGTTGRLVALTSAGTEKWTTPFKFTSTATPSSVIVDSSGTAYFGADDQRLYAVNPDGTLKWSCLTGGSIRYGASMSPDGRTLYATASDGRAYAVDAATGTLLWRSAAISAVYNCAVADDGSVYVGSTTGKLYAMKADGSQSWTFQMQSKVTCAPAIAKDGTIYIGSQDMNLYALNALGQQKWYYRTGGPIYSSPTTDAAGSIFFGAWPGKLVSLDPTDAALQWSYSIGSAIYAPPIIGLDGSVYVVSTNGTITKFASDAVPASNPEPSALVAMCVLCCGFGVSSLVRLRRKA